MKTKQPSKDTSPNICMLVSQEWVKSLVMGIIRMYKEQYDVLCPDIERMLDFTANELNRRGIYVLPKKEK